MASVGKASLTIVPKFDNLGKSVTSALDKVDASKSGEKMGQSLASGVARGTGGLARSGAVMGVFSAVTSKAMDLISSSVDGAVSRLDTLNNYPRVMQALGYSADESEASIAKMADHLTGLPTALNDMTSTVQGISAVTGDLTLATDAGLALNDMLLASGSSTQLTTAAMEQFRQMLAKGKPEMEDWKSLTSAMPGQMDQLAKAMLGPTANANDLYEALGGNKHDPTLTFDQLMAKMVEMDAVSTETFTSFAEQAKNATGGIGSSMSNMQTAVTRGMAGVMDSIGSDAISEALKGAGSAFEAAFDGIGDSIEDVKPHLSGLEEFASAAFAVLGKAAGDARPVVTDLVGSLADVAPSLIPAAAAFAAFRTGGTHLASFASRAKEARSASSLLAGANTILGTSFSPLSIGITAASAALGLCAVGLVDGVRKAQAYEKATSGLGDAMGELTGPIRSVSGAYESLGEGLEKPVKSLADVRKATDDAAAAHASLVDTLSNRASETQTSVGLLETYRATIDGLTGAYDENGNRVLLDAQQQRELEYAVARVNEQCGTQYSVVDAANGVIADQNGVIQDNTAAIDENIRKKQEQIQMDALTASATELYAQQQADIDNLSAALERQRVAQEKLTEAENAGWNYEALQQFYFDLDAANGEVERCQGLYDATTDALNRTYSGMEDVGNGVAAISSVIKNFGSDTIRALSDAGVSTDDLSSRLQEMGVTSSQVTSIGKDDFNAMVSSCGGDIEKLIGMIGLYNATPVVDKDGNVHIDDAALMDAQGELYVWNGTEFVGKSTNAAVDDRDLIDSQGNVWTWNGTELESKGATAVVTGNASDGTAERRVSDSSIAISHLKDKGVEVRVDGNYASAGASIWDLVGGIGSLASKTIDVVTNFITGGSQHASGGVRLNAEGGYRFHGAGAIATKAVELRDIVGEDGAEAIVPLTNKRYSLPFAKVLAEQMGAGSPVVDYDALAAAVASAVESAMSRMGVYLDGRALVGELGPGIDSELGRIEARRRR